MRIELDSEDLEKAIELIDSQQLKTEDGKNKGLFDAYDVGYFIGTIQFYIEHQKKISKIWSGEK
jgi:hypothetical protein